MPYDFIDYAISGPVATVTLNRPDTFNAISPSLETELHHALDAADADPDVRAIVLTGAGRAFSSGYDLAADPDTVEGSLDPAGRELSDYVADWQKGDGRTVERLMHLWRLTKPVIAAVNGYAMGAGFWYQLAADITIAADDAVFAQPEVRHISNSTFLFAALVGWKEANRYALTGDHFDADEAYRIGMVNSVVPRGRLLEEATALAERIALVPEPSVRMNKAITMLGLQASGLYSGMLMNGAFSALAHVSHGPERQRLLGRQHVDGMRGFLAERDDPFRPEPFGPRANRTDR